MIRLVYTDNMDGMTFAQERLGKRDRVFLGRCPTQQEILSAADVVALASILSGLSMDDVRKTGVEVYGFNSKKPWVLRKRPKWRVRPNAPVVEDPSH